MLPEPSPTVGSCSGFRYKISNRFRERKPWPKFCLLTTHCGPLQGCGFTAVERRKLLRLLDTLPQVEAGANVDVEVEEDTTGQEGVGIDDGRQDRDCGGTTNDAYLT
jgi:hypothetical protein